jgi:hypothetical protein
MDRIEAHAVARGYVWGMQDSGVKVDTDKVIPFANAYAKQWERHNNGTCSYMPAVQSCFREWMESNRYPLPDGWRY